MGKMKEIEEMKRDNKPACAYQQEARVYCICEYNHKEEIPIILIGASVGARSDISELQSFRASDQTQTFALRLFDLTSDNTF